MSFRVVVLALATISLLSAGQVLFKVAAIGPASIKDVRALLELVINPYFGAAISAYVVAVFMWMLVLREIPLQTAYPFVALAFILVPMLAYIFLGEALKWNTFLGAVLILVGVWVSTR